MVNDDALANRLNDYIINKSVTPIIEESNDLISDGNDSIKSDKTSGSNVKLYDILSVVWYWLTEFSHIVVIGFGIMYLFSITVNFIGAICIGYLINYVINIIEKNINKRCVKK